MRDFINNLIKTDARAFLIIGLFCLAGYSFMLQSPFKTMDDDFSIVRNAEIRDIKNIPTFFTSTYFKAEKDYYRPLVYVTYALEYRFFGLNYFYYNLDNVFLHILNAFLVFYLILLLVRDRRKAFLVAFLFAIHPVHWEAVGNVSGRAILLCAFFVLSGFIFFLKFVREDGARSKWHWLGLSVLCYALGLTSKESAGVLIMATFVFWLLFERGKAGWLKRGFWTFVPFFLVAVGYFWIRHAMGIVKMFPWPSLPEMGFGLTTFLTGLLIYARIFLLPIDLHFDRGLWVYKSFAEPGFWLTLVAYFLLIWFTLRTWRRWPAMTLFCLAWFLIELLPVSQIVTTIGVYPGAISLAEHFVYVASIPAFLLMVSGAERLYTMAVDRKKASPASLQFAFAGFFLFLYIILMQQNIYACNEFLMLRDSLAKDPQNSRLQYSMGMVYVKARNFDKALEHFRNAARIHPCNPNYHVALGKAMVDTGDYLAAAKEYEAIPDRGDTNLLLKDNKKAAYRLLVAQYEGKVKAFPQDSALRFSLGVFYAKDGNNLMAADAFEKTWELDPLRFDALFNVAVLSEDLKDVSRAKKAYEKLVSLAAPDNQFRQAAESRLPYLSK